MLFCPRCSAPQILLPEHMRAEGDGGPSGDREQTTGATPPPRISPADPHQIDWRTALSAAGMVALVATGLRLIAMKFDLISILWFFWLLAGANLALGIYARRRPGGWMDARVGMRIGVVTGLMMCSALAFASGVAGVIVRYGMHGMTRFDEQSEQDNKALRERIKGWMEQQNVDPETRKNYAATMNSPLMNSPEVKAGSALFGFAFEGVILVFLSGGAGAVNGMMRGARLARQRGSS